MAGHSNVAMTLGRDRHVLPHEQRAAVDRMEQLLTAAPTDLAARLAANEVGEA